MSTHSKIEIAVEALIQASQFHEASNYICSVILAGASQRVIRDLCLANGIESSVDSIGTISGFGSKRVHDLIVECYNKTKHADKDPNQQVFISSDEAKVLMHVAATDLLRLDPNLDHRLPLLFDYINSIKSNNFNDA